MRARLVLTLVALLLSSAVAVQAATKRVVIVEASDTAAYLKSVEQGRQLLKGKGSPATIRVWRARFAGSDAGRIAVSIEYPSFEALAKDDALMKSDAELKSWLAGLDKIRKVVSDSIYEELAP